MVGIIIGVILFIVAIVFFVNWNSDKKKLEQLTSSTKYRLGELVPVLQETKAALSDIGEDGCIKENVTVVGMPQCQTPLMSPIGNVPCLYYKYRISVTTKTRYQETDSNGKLVWRTRTDTDTLDEGKAVVPSFVLRDDTGSITVEPDEHDEFDGLIKSVDKSERNFQNTQMFNGGQLMLGRLSINVGDLFNMSTYDANTFGRVNGYVAPAGMGMNNMAMNNGMNNMAMNNGMNNMAMNNGMMNNGMMNNGMNNMAMNNGMMNNGMMNNGMMNNGMMNNGMNNGMMNNGMAMNNGMMNNGMMNNGMAMNNGVATAGVGMGSALSTILSRGGMPDVIHYVEEVFGFDRALTITGTVCDSMGDFRLRKANKSHLIISTKSSEDQIAETQKSIKTDMIVAVVCAALAVLCILLGIIL